MPKLMLTFPGMKPVSFLTVLLLAVGLHSCDSTSSKQNPEPIPNPSSKISPAARQTMDRRTEEAQRLQELNKVSVENKLSPYRYVISTERYSIFGQLVKASSHSRAIHGSGVTLLCPTDEAFESFDNWKMMLRKGNQEELDEFVAHHVLPIIMTYEDFKVKDAHNSLSGDAIVVSTKGGIYANSAHVRSGYIPTENGSIIGLDEVVFIPFSLR